ncbi:MAG: hypothetical protein WDO68_21560 [Gammaproteobacteria bacterium]
MLVERGFEFATKLMNVAELNATFSVGRNEETEFVLVESRGPDRNTDYVAGLEALLRGLADLDASIEDIVIDSAETRGLPSDQRRITLRRPELSIPPPRCKRSDCATWDITGAAAATGRSPEATGSGNPTKRLRLVFTEPEDLELFRIATSLVQNRGASTTGSKEFVFRPRPPTPGGGQVGTRKAMQETDVTRIHYQMQQSLYDSLAAAHGRDNVSCEGVTSAGRPADVIVRLHDGYELFSK